MPGRRPNCLACPACSTRSRQRTARRTPIRSSRWVKHSRDGAAHADSLVPLGETFEALRQELDAHMMKEEMVLFPMIRAGSGSVANPIRVMEHEHDSAGRIMGNSTI